MTLKIDAFSEVLEILKSLFSGVKSAAQLPETSRKEMRDALADTAQLIDETLTILKQHVTTVISELKFGDKQKAQKLVYELGNLQEWESKYRQFQLCDSLRHAVFNLEKKGLYKLLTKVSFNNPGGMQQLMQDYIGGETNAARSVGIMLQDLSQLANEISIDPDKVVNVLEEVRAEIGKWRQAFIDVEIEIRNYIR